jgi:hypothetical protein
MHDSERGEGHCEYNLTMPSLVGHALHHTKPHVPWASESRRMISHLHIGAVLPVVMLDLSVAFSDHRESPLNFQGILITEIHTISWTQYRA